MDRSEPTLLTAAWKRRGTVSAVISLGLILALLVTALRGERSYYYAQASILLQDPAVSLEGGGTTDRFVASQVEIIRSPIVAETASDALANGDPVIELSPTQLLEMVTISSSGDSSLVFLSVVADDPTVAVFAVNAVADGYREVSRLQATRSSVSALERIDAQLASLDERFSEVESEIQALRGSDPAIVRLEQQFREALVRVADLQETLPNTTDTDAADVLRQQISDLRGRISVYQQALEATPSNPDLQALLEEQTQLIQRRADLLARRDQISIDAELAPDAVALLDPATEAFEVVENQLRRNLAVGLVLGVLAAFGLAYLLEIRRRTFGARVEPEAILGAPLLADIPLFSDENLDSRVPVRDAPRSAAAEAFRFAAASLEFAMRSRGAKSVMVVASTLGHGKSTCVVNTSMATARQGHSVLVIDSDFGNQDVTGLLLDGEPLPLLGLTDIVEADVPFERALVEVRLGNEVGLRLLSRGGRPTVAANLLRSPETRALFEDVKLEHDLVFVDAPPMLQVAYASTLANYVDALVVVVSHGTPVRELEELVGRLKLIGKPVLGYLYNRSPLRREMTATEGSMMDILGEGLVEPRGGDRRRWWQRVGS